MRASVTTVSDSIDESLECSDFGLRFFMMPLGWVLG